MTYTDLSKLSLDERKELVHNSNTLPETLIILAKDEYCGVRSGVANNPNTPPETLIILAKDEDSDVRCAVENNPASTREIIQTKRAFEYLLELDIN